MKKKGSDLTGKKIENLAILEQQEGSAEGERMAKAAALVEAIERHEWKAALLMARRVLPRVSS